ncbi:MAG TPA: HIT family hydrolase, partial [Nocardioides sp.]|nr:HIT family hydrolase [Nocardioides sp.]
MTDESLVQDGIGRPDDLDRLWTPHRMAYVRGENRPQESDAQACPFCRIPTLPDSDGLVVHRGELAYVVLNL